MACTHAACPLFGALPASADELGRCRRCGQGLPGSRFAATLAPAAAGGATPGARAGGAALANAPVPPGLPPPEPQQSHTGLTQEMRQIELDTASVALGAIEIDDVDDDDDDITSSNDMFARHCETIILHHFELLQAQAATGPSATPLRLRSELHAWDDLHGLLRQVGLDPDEPDVWRRLGRLALEGMEPTAKDIVRSADWAAQLLDIAMGSTWTASDMEAVGAAKLRYEAAREACLTALPDLLQARRRHKQRPVPLYMELGPVALDLLCPPGGAPGEQCLTQLSRVLTATGSTEAKVQQDRETTSKLYAGDVATLQGLPCGAVLWAPTDAAALGRLRSALLRHCGDVPDFRCRLLSTLPTFQGCSDVDSHMDMCWSPLMGPQWAGLVKSIELLPRPLQMVSTGSAGPVVGNHGLIIATVAGKVTVSLPKLFVEAAPLFTMELGETYYADMAMEDVTTTLATLRRGLAPLRATLGDSERSPVHLKTAPRIQIPIHFPTGVSRLDIDLHMRHLRTRRADRLAQSVHIGGQHLYTDPGCHILEVTGPEAFGKAWPHCKELLAYTSDRALAIVEGSADQWKTIMNHILQEDPEVSLLRLRWRPSNRTQGGRPWAYPSASPQQLAAVRREARKGRGVVGLVKPEAEVKVLGHMGANPQAVVQKLIEVLGHHSGLALTESDVGPQPTGPTWTWLAKENPAAATGRVRVHLDTDDQARRFTQAVHGRAIQLGADLVSLECTTDLQDLEGNGLLNTLAATVRGEPGPGGNASHRRARHHLLVSGCRALLPPDCIACEFIFMFAWDFICDYTWDCIYNYTGEGINGSGGYFFFLFIFRF
ncbi:unnamed protein product, partial [Prorocentrum cordatum]